MSHPHAPFESPTDELEDALDVTGVLAFGTSLIGLGTVGVVSLLQIIGLLT